MGTELSSDSHISVGTVSYLSDTGCHSAKGATARCATASNVVEPAELYELSYELCMMYELPKSALSNVKCETG
jgi:hypothetical protein